MIKSILGSFSKRVVICVLLILGSILIMNTQKANASLWSRLYNLLTRHIPSVKLSFPKISKKKINRLSSFSTGHIDVLSKLEKYEKVISSGTNENLIKMLQKDKPDLEKELKELNDDINFLSNYGNNLEKNLDRILKSNVDKKIKKLMYEDLIDTRVTKTKAEKVRDKLSQSLDALNTLIDWC